MTKDQVTESWSTLIENGQDNADQLLNDTEAFIQASQVPDVRIERQQIAPGFASGLAGRTREFLVITERGNPRLVPYKMFLNARDYGNNLDVNWYLTYIPGLLQAVLSLFPFAKELREALQELDLFDATDPLHPLVQIRRGSKHFLRGSLDVFLDRHAGHAALLGNPRIVPDSGDGHKGRARVTGEICGHPAPGPRPTVCVGFAHPVGTHAAV